MARRVNRTNLFGMSPNDDIADQVAPGVELWTITKVLLSRPKTSMSTDLIRRTEKVPNIAETDREWYIEVSVVGGNVIHYVGEVILPESGEQPREELQSVVQFAHERATFLNTNGVGLPGAELSTYCPPGTPVSGRRARERAASLARRTILEESESD